MTSHSRHSWADSRGLSSEHPLCLTLAFGLVGLGVVLFVLFRVFLEGWRRVVFGVLQY